MRRTLRGQIIASSIAVLATMLALLAWNAWMQMERALYQRFESALQSYGPLLEAAAVPLIVERDYAAVADLVASNTRAGQIAYLELRDRRGQVLAASGDAAAAGLRHATRPLALAGQPVGELRYAIDTTPLAEERARLLRNSLLLGLAALAAGALLLAVATRRITGGFERLAQASRRVAEGDYGHRLPRSRLREIDEVSQAFGRMAGAVQQQLTELRESQRYLRSLIETLSEGVLVIARDGRVLDANSALLRQMRLDDGLAGRAEMPERVAEVMAHAVMYDADGHRIPPDQLPSRRALASGQAQRGVVEQVHYPDGRVAWLSVNATPLRREGEDEPHAVLVTVTDIARHIEAEQTLRRVNEDLEQRVQIRTAELREAKDAAERASQAKSEFLSRMSHELRTPLNAILGFAQLMLMRGDRLAEEDRHQLRHIETAGWHLLELINDVLDLSRIEAGAMTTSPEPVDLAALAAETLPLVQTQAAERGVQVLPFAGTAAGPCWARADRRRLKQVLSNLLSNGVKYNRRGGTVALRLAAAEPGRVALEVADTGPGFTPAEVERLFQPFTRFEREGGAEGTGIGLVITRRLVELMGGRLQLDATPGAGAVFRIELPATEPPAAPAPVPVGVTTAAPPPPTRPARVLYVEDNPSNVALLREVLGRRPGLELAVAVDGPAGLARALDERFDLVIVDIDLPGLDGVSLCRRLRAERGEQAPPLLALSANAMPADVARARAAGFVHYLTKPIDVAQVLATVDRLLARRSA